MCVENRTHQEVVMGVAVQYVSLRFVPTHWMTGELGEGEEGFEVTNICVG